MVGILSVGVAYAWFPSLFTIGSQTHQPGNINADANYSYWDKASAQTNKWTTISPSTPVKLQLGEMIRIDQLPAGTESYFRYHFNESATVQYNYRVILQSIQIIVVNNSGPLTIAGVNYYTATPSQKLFDFYYVLSATPDANPTTLFANPGSMTKYQVTSQNMILSGDFIAKNQYLYGMFTLRLLEVQNVIDQIPIGYSPYSLEFEFIFNFEKRTIDV